jgi:hypothetical protein
MIKTNFDQETTWTNISRAKSQKQNGSRNFHNRAQRSSKNFESKSTKSASFFANNFIKDFIKKSNGSNKNSNKS